MTNVSELIAEAIFVGIDVSKDTLEVALGECAKTQTLGNNDTGIAALLAELQSAAAGDSASDNPVQSYCWDALERVARVVRPEDLSPLLGNILKPLFTAVGAADAWMGRRGQCG